MQTSPTAPARELPPAPSNAKPGTALNPAWNHVFPLNLPAHGNTPQSPNHVGFGDPGNRIGRLLTIESDFPASMPQPSWKQPTAQRVGVAIAGGFVSFLIAAFIRDKIFFLLLDLGLRKVSYSLTSALGSLMTFVAFIVGASIGGAIYVMSKKFMHAVPSGPTYRCSVLGSEGFAIFTRGPERDTEQLVLYEGVSVTSSRNVTTTVRKNQYGTELGRSTSYDLMSVWHRDSGEQVYREIVTAYSEEGFKQQARFIENAEKAHFEHKLPRALEALEGAGIMFKAPGIGHIFISKRQVEVAIGQPFTVTPSQIAAVTLANGRVTMHFATGSPISFAMGHMGDAKLMLGCLSALGVKVG